MNERALREGRNNSGLELKIARLRAGIKQFELAAKVGIASTQLCEIETGRREVSPELLKWILGVIKSSKQTE
jgi:transcriptional regulator with XRE-family HTH domain